jgi:hypothetical protein
MAAHWPRRFSCTLIILCIAHPLVAQSRSAPIPSDAVHTRPSERLILLQPVCGAHANENGCSACPPGTDFPNDQLDVRGVVYGHFLGPLSDDAAVGFSGCESHASGLGGALLLSRRSGNWRLVSIRPAAIVEDCKKLGARDGHDVLVCFGQDGHQGVESSYLYLLDFALPWHPEDGLGIFLTVTDSAGGFVPINSPQEALVSGTIDRVSLAQTGRIVAETHLGSITSAEFEAAADYCLPGESTPNPLGLRIVTVLRTYTYLFNGKSVIPSPDNPATASGYAAIAPETRALLPSMYTAPDGSFAIPVPYSFKTISAPRRAASAVCEASALVCLLDPGDPNAQAAVEISRIVATTEMACLNPKQLPGRSSHFVPGRYGYSSGLGGGPAKYEFWTGMTAQYRVDQSVSRVWHAGACYQVAANIARQGNAKTNDDRIGQDLMRVVGEFRFSQPH